MKRVRTSALGDAIRAIDDCEAVEAARLLRDFESRVRQGRPNSAPELEELWFPFLRLLHRRGYFVSTPEEIARAFEEVREQGAGFDLYDLAGAIARCDRTLHECLRLAPRAQFPRLQAFAPTCDCREHHPQGGTVE